MTVNFKNINAYLKANKSENTCGHTIKNIQKSQFRKIGNLYDNSLGSLSYLSIQSEKKTEQFTGTYPLQDCLILECKKCKQVVFFHFSHGGMIPRPKYILADYKVDYLVEPAVKNVRIKKSFYPLFIEHFNLQEQDAKKQEGFTSPIILKDKQKTHLFNYREHQEPDGIFVQIDLVGKREFIKKVKLWLEQLEN